MVSQATTELGAPGPGTAVGSDRPLPDPGASSVVRAMRGLVVDDHAIALRGVLSLARETFPDAAAWHGASSGAEALELARAHQPDMVLMDVRTPDALSGPALVAQLLTIVPAAHVVVMVEGAPGDDLKRCLETGADGALWKGSPEDEIALVLRQVDGGDRIIDRRIAAELQAREEERLRAPVSLTDRERTVLGLLAEGCSNREIGERLVLAPATIKDHVRHLLRKLGATSRLQALVKATEAGLLRDRGRHVP